MKNIRKKLLVTGIVGSLVSAVLAAPTLCKMAAPHYEKIESYWVSNNERQTVVEVKSFRLFGYNLVDEGNDGLDYREETFFGGRPLLPTDTRSEPTEEDRQLYERVTSQLDSKRK